MNILTKNQLVDYLLKYTSAPADKPLMVWCGTILSLDDLFLNILTNEEIFKPSGKISSIEYYYNDAAFVINHVYANALAATNIEICTSFVREKHMPLIALVNDFNIPGKAKRPETPYKWGTYYDIEDIEELMPNNVKEDFIHVCYKPSLQEYINDLKSKKFWSKDLLPIFIDYAKSKMNLPYLDTYYLDKLFKETIRLTQCIELYPLTDDIPEEGSKKMLYLYHKEHNDEILAGEPFSAKAAESRKQDLMYVFASSDKTSIKDFYDLPKDFIGFLEGTSAAWLIDSTKPHPEPYYSADKF